MFDIQMLKHEKHKNLQWKAERLEVPSVAPRNKKLWFKNIIKAFN